MNKYKFNITWQTRARGIIKPIIEASSEEEARAILEDIIEIDFNETMRHDTEWDIDSIEVTE